MEAVGDADERGPQEHDEASHSRVQTPITTASAACVGPQKRLIFAGTFEVRRVAHRSGSRSAAGLMRVGVRASSDERVALAEGGGGGGLERRW